MPNLRHFRVRELLKRELGEILRREVPLETCGLITVNDVAMSNDLKSAVVFVSILGTPEQQTTGLEFLKKRKALIRGMLSSAVTLKYTPGLRFKVDDSIARGNRVLSLIEDLEKELPEEG